MVPLKIALHNSRFQALIGVGGIGSGTFFALSGNHTLGREESRSGRFLEARDYCKLHIIAHYVQTLLGSPFVTLPIGKVGDDEVGHRLLAEMRAAGLDLSHVQVCPGLQTLYAICFIYPDGTGGNLTTDQSACAQVDAGQVAQAASEFMQYAGRGIALVLPEVPLAAREKLLELGTAHRFFRVASFTSAEMWPAIEANLMGKLDLLAMNRDEAAAVVGMSAEDSYPLALVEATINKLRDINPHLLASITAGKEGSWSWDGKALLHVPALPAEVVSTAGAGDAHISGIIVGLVAGLTLSQAQELGTLVAALSVTSPHTIHLGIERDSLRDFASRRQAPLTEAVQSLLEAD
jgi:sugar/nucleoside kinase (ribokinase family)